MRQNSGRPSARHKVDGGDLSRALVQPGVAAAAQRGRLKPVDHEPGSHQAAALLQRPVEAVEPGPAASGPAASRSTRIRSRRRSSWWRPACRRPWRRGSSALDGPPSTEKSAGRGSSEARSWPAHRDHWMFHLRVVCVTADAMPSHPALPLSQFRHRLGSGVRMPKKEVLCRQIRSRCRPPSISFTCSSSARGSDPNFLRDTQMREADQPKRREYECGHDNNLPDTHQREFGAQRSHQDIAAAHTYFSSIINSAVLINGGASIALLAFYGNIFYLSW